MSGFQLPPVDLTALVNTGQTKNQILTAILNAINSLGTATLVSSVTLTGVVLGSGAATIATTFEVVPDKAFFGNLTGGSLAASVNLFGSDFANTGTVLTLGTSGVTAGTIGSASIIPVVGVDAKGRVVSLGSATAAASLISAINATDFVINSGTLNLSGTAKTRMLEFSIAGTNVASQNYQIVLTQGGTLPANASGAQGNVITNFTSAYNVLLKTVHSGTPTTQGTITIASTGSITWPTFSAVTLVAGDSVRLTNPGSSDATGADFALAFPFQLT